MSTSWNRVSLSTSASMSPSRAATDMCSSARRSAFASSLGRGPRPPSEAGVLEHVPGVADVLRVFRRHPRDDAVAARDDRDQALGVQAAHRVPDRSPADPELRGEAGLDQPRVGRELIAQDAAAQGAAYRFRK